MPEISVLFFLGTYVAGFLMFLAPCTLPLVPGFLTVLVGKEQNRRRLMHATALFCAGFSIVFILLGIFAGFAGAVLSAERWLKPLSGLIIIIYSLMLLNIIRPYFFIGRKNFSIPKMFIPGSKRGALLLGMLFSLGWSPCVGPIVASVLLIAATEGTALLGALLLFVFSLGLATPFFLSALFFSHLSVFFQTVPHMARLLTLAGALLLLLFGVLLLLGSDEIIVQYGTDVFYWLGLDIIFAHL